MVAMVTTMPLRETNNTSKEAVRLWITGTATTTPKNRVTRARIPKWTWIWTKNAHRRLLRITRATITTVIANGTDSAKGSEITRNENGAIGRENENAREGTRESGIVMRV